jgi:hypothetical protein
MIFNAQGKYLRSWGRGMFEVPHGLRIDPAGNVWTTDAGRHLVQKFPPEGKLLLTLGKNGQAGNTPETFNKPTDIAFARNGDFYVADGYGNKRIVKFSAAGKYLLEFGKPGSGRGEFNVPHSVALDSYGNVYVSDRENNRIQIFTGDGKFLRQWTHLGSTQNLFMTPKDELWIITHRENVEATALNTLGGRIMRVDVNTGKILGVIESPGHWIHVTPDALIFVGSLTGQCSALVPRLAEIAGRSARGLEAPWLPTLDTFAATCMVSAMAQRSRVAPAPRRSTLPDATIPVESPCGRLSVRADRANGYRWRR